MTQFLSSSSQYDSFNALRTRKSRNGLHMMPVAGPFPQSASVVAVDGGLEYDYISFLATRRGEPPVVPAPYTTNSNRVYLKGWQSAPFPVPDVGGVMLYAVAGFYVWGIRSPEGLESDFMIGSLPFSGLDPYEFIPSNYFAYDLLNQSMVRFVPGSGSGQTADGLSSALRNILDLQQNGSG